MVGAAVVGGDVAGGDVAGGEVAGTVVGRGAGLLVVTVVSDSRDVPGTLVLPSVSIVCLG